MRVRVFVFVSVSVVAVVVVVNGVEFESVHGVGSGSRSGKVWLEEDGCAAVCAVVVVVALLLLLLLAGIWMEVGIGMGKRK